jgi:hypothetical protein
MLIGKHKDTINYTLKCVQVISIGETIIFELNELD